LILAAPAFRQGVRKCAHAANLTNNTGNEEAGNMPPNETTGLLNGNGGGSHGSSGLRSWFSKDHTPGEDSHNRLISYPARGITVTKITLFSNYVNILLVFVPVGIIAGIMGWNPTVVFVLNFFAIIPLASVLSFATEEISMKLGETLGGLLNATFGNAVELIVSLLKQFIQ
jgi:Ca2+:H+ antiporter